MPLRWAIFQVKASAGVVKTKSAAFFEAYPVCRGMLAYSVIWPSGVILQEKFISKKKNIDYEKILRYNQ